MSFDRGESRLMKMASFFMYLVSSSDLPDGCIFKTISASFSIFLASFSMVAPASLKSLSVRDAFSPAPVSTVTLAPNLVNCLMVSGLAATRVSDGARSLRMAIFMELSLCFLLFGSVSIKCCLMQRVSRV